MDIIFSRDVSVERLGSGRFHFEDIFCDSANRFEYYITKTYNYSLGFNGTETK